MVNFLQDYGLRWAILFRHSLTILLSLCVASNAVLLPTRAVLLPTYVSLPKRGDLRLLLETLLIHSLDGPPSADTA